MSQHDPNPGAMGDGPLDGSVEPSALGASASIPVPKKAKRGGGGGTDGDDGSKARRRLPRPRVSLGMGSLLVVAAVAILALVPLVGTSLKKTPRDKVGISYGGGPIEGSHYQRIVQPGSSLFLNGVFDPLYLYPADQQNYIVAGSSSATGKGKAASASSSTLTSGSAIVAPSKDRVQVTYQAAVYFKLDTDRLRAFHEEFGLKYNAYTASGWKALIEDTLRQQLENALQEETRRYTVDQIYGDAESLLKIQETVQSTLSGRLRLAMGDQFFCAPTFRPGGPCEDPTFVLKKADLPASVVTAFEGLRTSKIGIEQKANEAKGRAEEAKGVDILAAALQKAGPSYALIKAIESGQIKFWVIPDSSGLTLNSGSGSGSAPTTPTTPGG